MYINISTNEGRVYGFRCDGCDTRFNNFLNKHHLKLNDKIKAFFDNKNIILLSGIDVKNEFKNQGFGNQLLKEFLNNSCDVFVLVSDVKKIINLI